LQLKQDHAAGIERRLPVLQDFLVEQMNRVAPFAIVDGANATREVRGSDSSFVARAQAWCRS
jgi:hypothetical protein